MEALGSPDVPGRQDRVEPLGAGKQVGREQVLLRVVALGDPLRVVEGQIGVMDAHDHAGRQPRQQLEEEHRRVRIHERPVGAVEEENVAGAQLVDNREIRLLERGADDLVAEPVDLGAGTRIDRDDPRGQLPVAYGPARELRRGA